MRGRFYRHVEHTADLAVEVFGTTLPSLFRHAVLAYFDLVASPKGIRSRRTWNLKVRAENLEEFLYGLLREVHYRQQTDGMLCRRVSVKLLRGESFTLRAALSGERFDPERHELRDEIKAVTLHGLSVQRVRRRGRAVWRAFVIFDV